MALIFHYDYNYDEVKTDCHKKHLCIYCHFIHSSFVFDGGSETLS